MIRQYGLSKKCYYHVSYMEILNNLSLESILSNFCNLLFYSIYQFVISYCMLWICLILCNLLIVHFVLAYKFFFCMHCIWKGSTWTFFSSIFKFSKHPGIISEFSGGNKFLFTNLTLLYYYWLHEYYIRFSLF